MAAPLHARALSSSADRSVATALFARGTGTSPVSSPYRPRIGPVSAPYLPRVCPVSAPYRPRIGPVSAPYRPRICPVSAPYRPRICPVSAPYLPRVCPGSAPAAVPVPTRTMATDELTSKLSRRLRIEDGEAEPVALDPVPSCEQEEDKAVTELGAKLQRREDLNEGRGERHMTTVYNPYTDFKEFSRKQIKDMEKMFKTFDAGKDNYIDLMELKLMMEKLEAPQTHLGLKNMIKEVDEDLDNKLSFREFLLIFRKAAAGELVQDSGLEVLTRLSEIDVGTEGVKGAKTFFEAKVQAINEGNRFEAEIREEQESKKQQAEEQKQRRAAFKELQSAFK